MHFISALVTTRLFHTLRLLGILASQTARKSRKPAVACSTRILEPPIPVEGFWLKASPRCCRWWLSWTSWRSCGRCSRCTPPSPASALLPPLLASEQCLHACCCSWLVSGCSKGLRAACRALGSRLCRFMPPALQLPPLWSLRPCHSRLLVCTPPPLPSHGRRMDELYRLDERTNSEIRSSWLQLCINAGAGWGAAMVGLLVGVVPAA